MPIDLLAVGSTIFATFKQSVDLAAFDTTGGAPQLIFTHTIPDWWAAGLGMMHADGNLYVSGDGGPSPIFDVSNPTQPRFLGNWDHSGGWAGPVAKVGELMLVANVGGGYFVFDISVPRNPRRLARVTSRHGSQPDVYRPTVILAGEGRLAMAVYELGFAEVIDLADPTQPEVVGQFPIQGLVLAAEMRNSHAFLGYRSVAQGYTPDFWDAEAFTDSGGIEVVDLGTPTASRSVARINLDVPVTDIALTGNWLLAAHADGGLTILDVRDKAHPEISSRWPGSGSVDAIPTRTGRVTVGNTLKSVAVTHRGEENSTILSILDFSDLTRPRLRAQLTLRPQSFSQTLLAREEDRIVLFDGDLVVIDISDPDQPQIELRQPLPVTEDWFDEWPDLSVSGGFVYLSMNERGLWVFELPRENGREDGHPSL